MAIRRAVDTHLSQQHRDAAAWHTRWRQAIEDTAGIAPYLEEGYGYVEKLRRENAAPLSRFDTESPP